MDTEGLLKTGSSAAARVGVPRSEYPRPLAVRREWQSLNGPWDFAFGETADRTRGVPPAFDRTILVPFSFEAPLSGIGQRESVHPHVWYRRRLEIPDEWRSGRVLLHFAAVDWEARVWINGHQVGEHHGGYTPFSFDITSTLDACREQEVMVAVFDPDRSEDEGYQPKGKQRGSGRIWYTRTTGIWQSVWLEPVHDMYMRNIVCDADARTGELRVTADVVGSEDLELEAIVSLDGRKVASGVGVNGRTQLDVREPQLWGVGAPVLYDVRVALRHGATVYDVVDTYVGFRAVEVSSDGLVLNGEPVFLQAVLDQGYWPDGIYTAPSEEALRHDITMTQAFGFNASRKHVKVEEASWYTWCDRSGLLVVQDMPSSEDLSHPAARTTFRNEFEAMVCQLRAHPSIVMWVIFNEDWGHPGPSFQREMVRRARALDPARPVIDASGWHQTEETDLEDVHDYQLDLSEHVERPRDRPRWIGEYGGISLPVPGHSSWTESWGYDAATDATDLVERFSALTRQITRPDALAGYCYTQLTDVEAETNGLMTYDRVPKAAPEEIAGAIAGKMSP